MQWPPMCHFVQSFCLFLIPLVCLKAIKLCIFSLSCTRVQTAAKRRLRTRPRTRRHMKRHLNTHMSDPKNRLCMLDRKTNYPAGPWFYDWVFYKINLQNPVLHCDVPLNGYDWNQSRTSFSDHKRFFIKLPALGFVKQKKTSAMNINAMSITAVKKQLLESDYL